MKKILLLIFLAFWTQGVCGQNRPIKPRYLVKKYHQVQIVDSIYATDEARTIVTKTTEGFDLVDSLVRHYTTVYGVNEFHKSNNGTLCIFVQWPTRRQDEKTKILFMVPKFRDCFVAIRINADHSYLVEFYYSKFAKTSENISEDTEVCTKTKVDVGNWIPFLRNLGYEKY